MPTASARSHENRSKKKKMTKKEQYGDCKI